MTSKNELPATAAPAAEPTCQSDVKRQVLNRLRRAQGQLAAVISTVESSGECRAVVTQLAAVASAVERAGFLIIAAGMRSCLDESARADAANHYPTDENLSIEELEKLFMILS